MTRLLLSGLYLLQVIVQAIEAFLPETTKRLEPGLQFLERFAPQAVDSPVGLRQDFHNGSLAQHLEVLRYLRLPYSQPPGELAYRQGAIAQQLDNMFAVGIRQSSPQCFHGYSIPEKEYSCQGIFLRNRHLVRNQVGESGTAGLVKEGSRVSRGAVPSMLRSSSSAAS